MDLHNEPTNRGSNLFRTLLSREWIPAVLCGMLGLGLLGLAIHEALRNPVATETSSATGNIAARPEPASPSAPPVDLEAIRREAWERIQPRLDEADRAVVAQIEPRLADIRTFFHKRKAGSRGFAKDSLSIWSKLNLVKSHLPFANGDEHHRYLAESFGRHLFTPEDLHRVIQDAVQRYLDSLRDIEDQLLVELRADLNDLPPAALPAFQDVRGFQNEYRRLLDEIAKQTASDLKVDLSREAIALISAEIAGQVLVTVASQLGISAGLIGTGAATSWSSLGLTLVAAIFLDIAIDWASRWFYDPEKKIIDKVNSTIDRVSRLVTKGDGPNRGLDPKLRVLAERRASIRREAIRRCLFDTE